MLAQLVESSPRRGRRRISTVVSIVLHALVLSVAAAAARPVPRQAPAPDIVIPVVAPPPDRRDACGKCGSGGPRRGRTYTQSLLPEPVTSTIEVDVAEIGPIVDGIEISRDEWKAGTGQTHESEPAPTSGTYVVDREVVPWPTNPVPRYPAELRAVRLQGSVSARFVVDTTGHVIIRSVIVDAATHTLFADAVVEALRRSRYAPAELRGRKVRQLVSQSFVFVMRD